VATWKLEDAKNQFSRLVRAAKRQPQVVTRHGREEVVVVSIERYRQLAREEGPGLVEFMRGSPLAKALASGDVVLTRTRDLPREIEL
jgi:prevent-host-death family protein